MNYCDPKVVILHQNVDGIVDVLVDERLSLREKVLKFFMEYPEYTQIHESPFDFLRKLDAEENKSVYKPLKTLVFAIPITLSNYRSLLRLDRVYNGLRSEIEGMFDGWFSQKGVYGVIFREESNGGVYCISCRPYFGYTIGRLITLLWNGGSKKYKI